jgi:hypothetical protein
MSEDAKNSIELAGRHRLILERGGECDTVKFVTPQGGVPLSIEVSPTGVTLKVADANVSLEAAGTLSISARNLVLKGREGLMLSSDGHLDVTAGGDMRSRAQAQIIRAERGPVDVKATDDVKLSGERVMINCDETVDVHFRGLPTASTASQGRGPSNSTNDGHQDDSTR